jgi:hypothetical protein
MTLLYRKINVENFDQVQQKLVPWVKQHFRWTFKFWNHVDQDRLFTDIPELPIAVERVIGQKPLHTYMLAIPQVPDFILRRKIGPHSLHRDTSVESVRFNWPVLNGASIETKLFTSTVEPKYQQLTTSKETYLSYREEDCEQIGSFFLDQPALLHVHTIHGLYRATGPLPRYILSFKFDQPIDHLLEHI